jgi:hypothetical protein
MAEQTGDGMYEGLYGQKFVNETEADRSKADWNAQNYGGSNTYLNDFANSAAGKGLGNLLGNLGVVLALVVLPMYYVPNFIVRVLADFGIMASFWPMFFIVWIPVLALIILVMIKSSPGARVVILALVIIPIMGTIGVLQMVKVVGGNNADYPYEWYLKALSEKKFEERAEKNLYKVGLTIKPIGRTEVVTPIYAEPSRNSKVLKDIPNTAFITLTYKRSPDRNMESVEYQGVEGWINIHNGNSIVIKLRSGRTITIKRETALLSKPKNLTERELENNNNPAIIKKIKKGQSVTILGESEAEIALIENTGKYFVKVEHKGDTGWIRITGIW